MAKELILSERFKKNYKNLPKKIQKIFERKLNIFLENPAHPSLNIHKYRTQNNETIWEAYVTMNYRFTFEIIKDSYILRNIGSHSIIDKGKV